MSILTDDFKLAPYWWDETPRPALAAMPVPAKADVAIVGSGYTGLCAAIELARAGRHVVIFDAEDAGWGCSSRNGGQISTSLKPDFASLSRCYGKGKATAILREGDNALQWIGDFITQEGIECSYKVTGRFHAAHNRAQFEKLAKSFAGQPHDLESSGYVVSQAEQRAELGTDAYFGGAVYPHHASLDPGKYHQGLLHLALKAGASIIAQCPVTSISKSGVCYQLDTAQGSLIAQHVIVATNGYTGALTPWQRRRVIPIGSYMIATQELPDGLMDQLMPKDRVISDTRKVVYYFRPSPDRKRILFGGRVSTCETDPSISAPLLRRDMIALFPELADVKISHSWMGFVAYTFDTLPHIGRQDGIYYAMGYCGSGVSMSSYLGTKLGQQVRGLREGQTGFDGIGFPTRPFYHGRPWFLGAALRYYQFRDRLNV